MGYLTRASNYSTGSLSSGAGTSGVFHVGDYAAFGLLQESTGAHAASIGFNVGISTGTLQPLMDESGIPITTTLSTTTKQCYALPAELAVWRYAQISSTAGSTTLPFTLVMKG